MNKEEFIQFFAEQFDETEPEEFKAETEFRQLEEWDSMVALMVIAMIDEEYNVKVSGDDIRNSTTIADLMAVVESKK
ncbi:acyl carrier protein [Jiulongibacter sediminis]|jgi:acyl carrier protein|uniref:Acyl carrier protein n=1 Tax=Jiulongibacter sediminis TaxID=1605367 RepID=A0A0P7C7Y8_9BACT|nr:acyl carrier protein [Jiulongibacter sediminis]KPM48568.1 acyl carrier protein [Jiulongibacter sediminis]TBX25106.1 acyl carrier protein [Jiulongibacter sediminis]